MPVFIFKHFESHVALSSATFITLFLSESQENLISYESLVINPAGFIIVGSEFMRAILFLLRRPQNRISH